MSEENVEQVREWFEKHEDDKFDFDSLKNKRHECKEIAGLMFMASKLNKENKGTKWFIGGDHDVIYIGENMSVFDDFTEEDVIMALNHGINWTDEGFQMMASL